MLQANFAKFSTSQANFVTFFHARSLNLLRFFEKIFPACIHATYKTMILARLGFPILLRKILNSVCKLFSPPICQLSTLQQCHKTSGKLPTTSIFLRQEKNQSFPKTSGIKNVYWNCAFMEPPLVKFHVSAACG